MSAPPKGAGTLAAQSGVSPPPQHHHQQAGGPQPHAPAVQMMGATGQDSGRPAAAEETLAPAPTPISLAGPEVSEDEGEGGSGSAGKKKKKQRSMAELIKGLDLNMGDDGCEDGIDDEAAPEGDAEATSNATAAADSGAPPAPAPAAAASPKAADKSARKRKKAGDADGDGGSEGEGEAKGSAASPAAADLEAQQTPLSPGGASGRRERKKSKYLSPPYTMVLEKKPSFSARSGSMDALDPDDAGGAISSPLARCGSSHGRRRREELDLDRPFAFDEVTPSIAELLSELRCVAVEVMYLMANRHSAAFRGCFGLFRTYSYVGTIDGHGGGIKTPVAAARVEETKPGVLVEETKPAPPAPVAPERKVSAQQDKGGDNTPDVASAKKNVSQEANKSESASGKRGYSKKKSDPAAVATTTEANGGVEKEQPRPRGRPRKKNKEKEENNSAVDGTPTAVVCLPAVPSLPAGNKTPTPTPTPAPAPALAGNKTPTTPPAPAPALAGNKTPTPTPLPAPALALTGNNTPTPILSLAPSPAAVGNSAPTVPPASATVCKSAPAVPTAPAPAAAVTQLQANGSSSTPAVDQHPPQQNEAKKRKRKRRSGPPGSASLIVTFAPGADLPTKDHLLAFFSRYGALDEVRTDVRPIKRVACVAYANKADAQKAIASPDRDQAFAPGAASFRIKYARQARQGAGEEGPVAVPAASAAGAAVLMPTLAIPRLPLEFVKKSLESMIAALEASRPAGAGSRLVPVLVAAAEADPRDELVDQMSNLLTKVNKLLADGAASEAVANGAAAAPASSGTAAAATALAAAGPTT